MFSYVTASKCNDLLSFSFLIFIYFGICNFNLNNTRSSTIMCGVIKATVANSSQIMAYFLHTKNKSKNHILYWSPLSNNGR